MDLTAARTLARDLMDAHGLTDWTLTFDKAKGRFGVCRYRTRTIGLSAPLVALNGEDDVRDTILHEIAHALAGPGTGHGPVWKATAKRIGARPERTVDAATVNTPTHAWTGACPTPGCEFTVGRHRLTDAAKRGACPDCCKRLNYGRFSADYRLVWRRTA